jgi:5-methylcytosine-specific restriction protein A
MPQRAVSHRATTGTRPRQPDQRATRQQRGYGAAWQRARDAFLSANPLCVECLKEGKGPMAANVVDHIIPHKGDHTLFWDQENNWQALCKRHHDAKTVREDGGFGNRVKEC